MQVVARSFCCFPPQNRSLFWRVGTPLREVIKTGRVGLNDVLVSARTQYAGLEESVQDKLATSKAHTEAMLGNLGSECPFVMKR